MNIKIIRDPHPRLIFVREFVICNRLDKQEFAVTDLERFLKDNTSFIEISTQVKDDYPDYKVYRYETEEEIKIRKDNERNAKLK